MQERNVIRWYLLNFTIKYLIKLKNNYKLYNFIKNVKYFYCN